MLPHPLINFEIQKYGHSELKFKGVYSRNNLPKTINDEVYVVNLEYISAGTLWITLYASS